MDPLIGMGLISGAGSLLGGLLGMSSQSSANRQNMELAKYSFDRNVDMWNMQNEYNLPINQMERLRAAGLNPNLVYGNGSVTGNTIGSAPQMETPHVNPTTNGGFISDAVNHALVTPAQVNNLNSQTSVNEATQAVKIAERVGKDLDNNRNRLAYRRERTLYQNSLDMANEALREMKSRADVREKEAAIKQIELEIAPLRKTLTNQQIELVRANASRIIWDLNLEKGGRIPTNGSVLNWVINQVIRAKNGEPSVIDPHGADPFTAIEKLFSIKDLLK